MNLKILILLAFIAYTATSNGYAQNSKKDTVRKVSWAVRIAGGVNFLRYKYPDVGDYLSHNVKSDGNLAQIGIKFSTNPFLISIKGSRPRNISLTSELNYIVSQHHLNYSYYVYNNPVGTSYEANYILTMHSAQLAILPKVTIGAKKIIYISFGLFGSKPFSSSSKGTLVEYVPGYGTGTFAGGNTTEYFVDDEIKTRTNNFNWGVIANFGLNIPVKKQLLAVEVRLQPGLTNTFKNPDLINYSTLLSASYSFW